MFDAAVWKENFIIFILQSRGMGDATVMIGGIATATAAWLEGIFPQAEIYTLAVPRPI